MLHKHRICWWHVVVFSQQMFSLYSCCSALNSAAEALYPSCVTTPLYPPFLSPFSRLTPPLFRHFPPPRPMVSRTAQPLPLLAGAGAARSVSAVNPLLSRSTDGTDATLPHAPVPAHRATGASGTAAAGPGAVLDPLPASASAEKAVESALAPAMAAETQGLPLVSAFTFAVALVLFLLTAYLNSIMAKTAWKIAEKGRLNYDVLPLPDLMHSVRPPSDYSALPLFDSFVCIFLTSTRYHPCRSMRLCSISCTNT